MFKLNKNADTNGTYLCGYCPDRITDSALLKAFGQKNDDYYDPEKGYAGGYRFSDENGNVVNLYPRWGVWRIGAHSETTAKQFEAWLCNEVGDPF